MYNYKNFRKLDDASTNIDLCIYELYSSNYVIHSADEYIIDGVINYYSKLNYECSYISLESLKWNSYDKKNM